MIKVLYFFVDYFWTYILIIIGDIDWFSDRLSILKKQWRVENSFQQFSDHFWLILIINFQMTQDIFLTSLSKYLPSFIKTLDQCLRNFWLNWDKSTYILTIFVSTKLYLDLGYFWRILTKFMKISVKLYSFLNFSDHFRPILITSDKIVSTSAKH